MISKLASKTTILMLMGAVIFLAAPPSIANSSPSVVELQKVLAALEARVAALEQKLQRYEGSATQGEQATVAAPRPLLVSLSNEGADYTPMRLSSASQIVQPQPPDYAWTGLYWGTSFGYGSAFSKSRYRALEKRRQQSTSVGSDTEVDDDGSVSTRFDTSTNLFEETSVTTGASNGTDQKEGALADLYLGVSAHLAPRLVAGVQVEGTLAEMTFGSTINRRDTSSTGTSTNTQFSTSSDGDESQSKRVSSSTDNDVDIFPETAEVQLDWMVSVIGRAGVLATPSTFLYGLAGWSYGHFDVEDLPFELGLGKIQDFASHGLTVGGGLEKKLSPKWSLRAEYRYTNFGSESFSVRDRTSSSSADSGPEQASNSFSSNNFASSSASTGTQSDDSTSTTTRHSTGSIDNDMHLGRIGVTRYFILGD